MTTATDQVTLRLRVENQDAIGADNDETHGYLHATGWIVDNLVTVAADQDALNSWFTTVFLPLRADVREIGWGTDDIDAEMSGCRPSLVVFCSESQDSARGMEERYAADESATAWAHQILQGLK